MKNSLSLVVAITLLSACGQPTTERSNQAQGQKVGTDFNAQDFYYQLSAPDMKVGSGYTAVITEQRESTTHFCRRSQSLGATVYQYVCYQLTTSGAQAQSTFTSLQGSLQGSFSSYSVTIANLVGSQFIDEITNGPMYGGGQTLCQKVTPQNPSAGTTYRCFGKL